MKKSGRIEFQVSEDIDWKDWNEVVKLISTFLDIEEPDNDNDNDYNNSDGCFEGTIKSEDGIIKFFQGEDGSVYGDNEYSPFWNFRGDVVGLAEKIMENVDDGQLLMIVSDDDEPTEIIRITSTEVLGLRSFE